MVHHGESSLLKNDRNRMIGNSAAGQSGALRWLDSILARAQRIDDRVVCCGLATLCYEVSALASILGRHPWRVKRRSLARGDLAGEEACADCACDGLSIRIRKPATCEAAGVKTLSLTSGDP
jgi:hypothetical protein